MDTVTSVVTGGVEFSPKTALERIAGATVRHELNTLPAELLTRYGLAAYAYGVAPASARRTDLVQAFAEALTRHRFARRDLSALLATWQQVGVDVMVFKGFFLAEWVYRHPAERPYCDVDLLIDPAATPLATRLARQAGWTVTWSREGSLTPFKHEEVQLASPTGHVLLDVHRFALHTASPLAATQRRITREVWRAAGEAWLDDVTVKIMAPEDNVLVGLALNRFWSPDNWTPRPHDYLDLEALRSHYDLDLVTIGRRAEELGCARTWAMFLEACNPWEGRFRLTLPPLVARQRLALQVALERPHPQLEGLVMRAVDALLSASDTARALPLALRAVRAARDGDAEPRRRHEARRSVEARRAVEGWPVRSAPRPLGARGRRAVRYATTLASLSVPHRSRRRVFTNALRRLLRG